MDIQAIRKLFPVTEKYIFLNNAAESPLNLKIKAKIDEYLDLALYSPQDKPSVREDVRENLADLLGGDPSEYALTTSTGIGISMVAAGYSWSKGDNIVVPCNEHWNNSFPWKALKQKGVDVRFVELDENNRIKLEDVEALTDGNTKIVTTAAVSFNSGFRADLKKLSKIAHSKGALFVVDGIQGAGAVPMNVEDDDIDILSCAGFKWLLGMPGTGFLYVNKNIQELITPTLPGMFAADLHSDELEYHLDARRFETGSIPYSLFYGWNAGLDLLKETGIENIYKRILMLTDRIIYGLQSRNIEIKTPIDKVSERSSIIIFTLDSKKDNKILYKELLANNIIVTLRDGLIRISPSFYNTEEEVDSFLSFL